MVKKRSRNPDDGGPAAFISRPALFDAPDSMSIHTRGNDARPDDEA